MNIGGSRNISTSLYLDPFLESRAVICNVVLFFLSDGIEDSSKILPLEPSTGVHELFLFLIARTLRGNHECDMLVNFGRVLIYFTDCLPLLSGQVRRRIYSTGYSAI